MSDSFLAWAGTIQKVTLAHLKWCWLNPTTQTGQRDLTGTREWVWSPISKQPFIKSKTYWNTIESLRLEGTSGGHLVSPSSLMSMQPQNHSCCQTCSLLRCASQVSYVRYLRRNSLRIFQLRKRKARLDDMNNLLSYPSAVSKPSHPVSSLLVRPPNPERLQTCSKTPDPFSAGTLEVKWFLPTQ